MVFPSCQPGRPAWFRGCLGRGVLKVMRLVGTGGTRALGSRFVFNPLSLHREINLSGSNSQRGEHLVPGRGGADLSCRPWQSHDDSR